MNNKKSSKVTGTQMALWLVDIWIYRSSKRPKIGAVVRASIFSVWLHGGEKNERFFFFWEKAWRWLGRFRVPTWAIWGWWSPTFSLQKRRFFGFVKSREKKIYFIPQTQYRAAWLWAAWPKFLQFRVGAPVAVVLFVNPAPPPAYGAVPSLPPPPPPADLPSADLPRAPWCLPNLSASRQVG